MVCGRGNWNLNQARRFEKPEPGEIAVANEIDAVCDAFERAWQSGYPPSIEDFLDRCVLPARERLLTELLLVDREFRIKRGESVTRLDYHRRFPDYSIAIDAIDFATIVERRSVRRITSLAPSPLQNSRLARFELLEELGKGAFGTVWKARDSQLRRLVAIKMPRHERLCETDRVRFVREGQAIAQLRHPNIVAVHEVGDDPNGTYLVTEFIDGLNLREWLCQHRPNPEEAAELTAQIAEALHHAHELGVIHRDLKPANVLIDRKQLPHITDFGLAKWTADNVQYTIEGDVLGTPAYMSPEQARGEASNVDRRSDVYGLGALLYEMLTGQPPFQGELAAIIHQVIYDEPVSPRKTAPNIPRDLETICIKAMEKDLHRRYPSAQEMAVDLRRYLRNEPILARRVSIAERSWRWLCRRPAVAASFALILTVVLAGLVIASLQQKNYRLQGYRQVLITTVPAGARVAVVPIDSRTGELNPDPSCIMRLPGTTPIKTELTPAEYFIEAVLPGDHETPDFAEAYRTVTPETVPRRKTHNNANAEGEQSAITFIIEIHRTREAIARMVPVTISEEFRRANALLPKVIYVDARKTTLASGKESNEVLVKKNLNIDLREGAITLDLAKRLAELSGKRLASALEYEAIINWANDQLSRSGSTKKIEIEDLSSGAAEWTTTVRNASAKGVPRDITRLRNMRVLAGPSDVKQLRGIQRWLDGTLIAPPDFESSMIGFRGVRSGSPRFVTR